MRILVTGGDGFIGRRVAERVRVHGHEPVLFDRTKGSSNETVILGDVRDADSVDEAVYHADGVIHLAGILGTQETVQNPYPSASTNIIGALNVFESVARHKTRCVDITVGNYWMLNPYSITKWCTEKFALMYNAERGTQIAVVRGMNAYGPGQKVGPVRKVIPTFVCQALANEDITVYGDGTQKMDMIYVDDLAEILVLALLRDHGVYDDVIDAGTGVALSVNEIAETIISACGSSSKLKHLPMRPGETPNDVVCADMSVLKSLWPVTPRSVSDGITPTIEWYRKHQEPLIWTS